MNCPICGCKDWVLEIDPLSECGHDLNDIRIYIERLRSIIGRSSDQIDNINKTIDIDWFEEQRLKSIQKILKEV